MQGTKLKMRFRRTAGFSLIELLIVVAIIAALVGVAVPMFQKNIAEAHSAKAKEDLDTIRNALTLYDSQNRPLTGTSLKPLLGRYLQDIPKDPWGNDYLLDAGVGVVMSFGSDQKAGGTDEDEDIITRYKSDLKIQSCVINGPWGQPQQGTTLVVKFNKPISGSGGAAIGAGLLKDLVILKDYVNGGRGISLDGSINTTGSDVSGTYSWGSAVWGIQSVDGNGGTVTIACTTSGNGSSCRLTPTCAINIGSIPISVTATSAPSATSIFEQYTAQGPLDASIYGTGVMKVKAAVAIEMVGTENRGVPIQRP